MGEYHSALLGMARREAPGSDGLPMEFYIHFWEVLGQDLVDVLNTCYAPGSLSLSQRRGIISLVFKRGDTLDGRNWRPITQLNVDYKLASRVLAGRLLKVIHVVVGKDQTCGVPGRFIGENVALHVDCTSFSNVPAAVLSLDQEKAFDRVDWSFMLATLSKVGFGPSFLHWVRLFYTVVQSCVNVNGYLSPFFVLSRGVRQGCPLSPLLYVLVSEVLAVNIRANPRITGLPIPGSQTPLLPISQYADDTSLIVNSDDAILAVFDTHSRFEAASGSKLNVSKSKGLWLGAWNNRRDPLVKLEWTSEKIKVLGLYVGPGDLEEANMLPRIAAVENVLSSWRQRTLSFRGRALVIGSLALSRIWYVASLIHMPLWVHAELARLIFPFFWKGKPDLVAREVLTQPPTAGGFSVVDIKSKVSSLLVQWIWRYASSPSGWVTIFSFWFSNQFHATIDAVLANPSAYYSGLLPPCYRAWLSAWREVEGSYSQPCSSFVVGSFSPYHCCPVTEASAKHVYQFLLSESRSPPRPPTVLRNSAFSMGIYTGPPLGISSFVST